MTTALTALAAPPAATPAPAAAGPAADSGDDGAAFARELQRAHDGTDRTRATNRPSNRPAEARQEKTADSKPPKAARPPVEGRSPEPAADGDPAAGTEAAATTGSADLSALFAGLMPAPTPRVPAPDAAPPATAGEGVVAGAAPGRPAGRAAPDRADGVAAGTITEAAEKKPAAVGTADTAAAPSGFTLPAALPSGAAGAQGGAALAAPAEGTARATPAPLHESQVAAPVGSTAFGPALGAEVTLLVRHGVQEARLQLNPAEMGPITVQIQIEGERAQVSIAAEQAPTRQALEQALPTLAGALRENGLTLTGGGVFEQPRPPRDDRAPAAPTRAPGDRGGEDGADAPATRRAPPPVRGVVDLYA